MVQFLSLAVLAGLSAVSTAIPTIEAKGSKLFTSEGNQFYVKGIAYQLVPGDPLVDADQCRRDSALMKTLGTNSIRVYHVLPEENHDECMKAFADAGIYIWVDLDTFDTYVEEVTPRWEKDQHDAYAKVMDTFHVYDNVAGFFVGNEGIASPNGSAAAPYIKAAARDMKAYRDKKGYREIPIGYSAADIASLRPMLQNYLGCGSKDSDRLDFFSLNAYSWCGDSSYEQSGYNMLEENSMDLNIPIFMSETGCNTVRPRDFKDQEALFGEMADTWSGSIIYEWIQEMNDYGLVSYGDRVEVTDPIALDGFPRSGTPTPVQPDFDNLSKVWATLHPTGIKAADYNPTQPPVKCPEYTSGAWEVNPSSPLPTLGQKHDFDAEAATTSFVEAAPTNPAGSSQPAASGTVQHAASGTVQHAASGPAQSVSGTGPQSASGTAEPEVQPTGGATDGLSRELKDMGVALMGAMAAFAWM